MTTLIHPHFGEVHVSTSTTDLSTTLAGQRVRVDLNVEDPDGNSSGIMAVLDRAAALAELDVVARAAIGTDASEEDSSASMYVDHHLSEFGAKELSSLFGTNDPAKISPDVFSSKMRLVRAGLYPDSSDAQVVLDYSVDPESTQYILCVSFDANGVVSGVEMES